MALYLVPERQHAHREGIGNILILSCNNNWASPPPVIIIEILQRSHVLYAIMI